MPGESQICNIMRINEEALNFARAQLDEEVKKLLARKTVLAWILRRNVSEFSQMSLDDIAACIEDEPEIGTRMVNPGAANSEIYHASKEDSVPGEGRLEAMCNYSDLVEEKGIEKGIGLGELRGKILARFEDGKTPEEIAGRMNLTLEQVRAVLAGQTISR